MLKRNKMDFITTFIAVFTATIIAQISTWWFKKELEHRIDNGYNKIKKGVTTPKGDTKMVKLAIDIEPLKEGMWKVTKYSEGSEVMGMKMKAKVEYEEVFKNRDSLTEWLDKKLDSVER